MLLIINSLSLLKKKGNTIVHHQSDSIMDEMFFQVFSHGWHNSANRVPNFNRLILIVR